MAQNKRDSIASTQPSHAPGPSRRRPRAAAAAATSAASAAQRVGELHLGGPNDGQQRTNVTPALSPEAVGGDGSHRSIGQTFNVNPSNGTLSIALPIRTSPGRRDFGPSLELAYSSGSGNGIFGIGWSLGLRDITRKTTNRTPTYTESDPFIFAGEEELVPVPSVPLRRIDGFLVHEFKLRVVDPSLRLERWTSEQDETDMHWRVTSGDNVTTIYGRTDESRLVDLTTTTSRRIFSWLPCERYDSYGNLMIYNYKPENSQGISDLPPELQACEAIRTDEILARMKHLKSVQYGNRSPNRGTDDWKVKPYSGRWLFEVIFDYGDHDLNAPTPACSQPWSFRRDSFSSYASGFELRCHRLCRRVLMFHHFRHKPGLHHFLVSSTALTYHESSSLTLLATLTERGHSQSLSDSSILTQSLPPYKFEYSKAMLSPNLPIQRLNGTSLIGLPGPLTESIQWLDLDGEGTSGLLQELESGSWSYQRNEKCANALSHNFFGKQVLLPSQPNLFVGQNHYFDHLGGDSKLALISIDGQANIEGYYERQDKGWGDFVSFCAIPRLDTSDPAIMRIDLTGSGRNDLAYVDQETDDMVWYECLGKEGYGPEKRTKIDSWLPQLNSVEALSTLRMADMCGDGRTDIVSISPGKLSYWPNLSYGMFGKEIIMFNAPQLDSASDFSPQRVLLADIDGSGTADLLYFPIGGGAEVYFNLAGNGWSSATPISSFPQVHQLTSVFVMDLLGNGTSCLCWTGPDALSDASQDLNYIDLTSGIKPNLLESYSNGFGTNVDVLYKPSTWFYFQDEYNGTPWKTKIGFPLQCVSEVRMNDAISCSSSTAHYAYHDGYFDPCDREFRGFGMVERWDAEAYYGSSKDGGCQPPVLTKTWYHTGASDPSAEISRACALPVLAACSLPDTIAVANQADARRAFKGLSARVEIYCDDKSTRANCPYQILETTYQLHEVQSATENVPGVYRVASRETLTSHHERSLSDPRRSHELVLQTDDFNNVLKSATVHYGRQQSDLADPADQAKQTETDFFFQENDYTNHIDENESFFAPQLCASRQFRLLRFSQTGFAATGLFSYDALVANDYRYLAGVAGDILDSKDSGISTQNVAKLAESRSYYKSRDLTDRLPLGKLEAFSIMDQSFDLAFTPTLLQQFYADSLEVQKRSVEEAMTSAGYKDLDADGSWWRPSARSSHATTSEAELDSARQSFYTPAIVYDAFGNRTTTTMDRFQLLPELIEDSVGNTTTMKNDYVHLRPWEVTDPNHNRQIILYDGFGRLVVSAQMGKRTESLGDSVDGVNPVLSAEDIDQFLRDPSPVAAAKWLKNAGALRIHDDCRYVRSSSGGKARPSVVIDIVRTAHVNGSTEPGEILVTLTYQDGSAAPLQEVRLADSGQQKTWRVSEWSVRNKNGSPFQTFQPSFTDNCEFALQIKTGGLPTTTFYDPLGRVVATANPDRTFSKVCIAPWSQTFHDEGDTVKIDDPAKDPDVGPYFAALKRDSDHQTWYRQRVDAIAADAQMEKAAARKSEVYSDTPEKVHFDAAGRAILQITDNKKEKIRTRFEHDLAGNCIEYIDERRRVVEKLEHDLLGRVLRRTGMDDGIRWHFLDCMNRITNLWTDGPCSTSFTYDPLGRELETRLLHYGEADVLIKKTVYGEKAPQNKKRNLRGQPWTTSDQAGIRKNCVFDFKGNCTQTETQFAAAFKTLVNWDFPVALMNEEFETTTTFDALNRQILSKDAGGGSTRHVFNSLGEHSSVGWKSSDDDEWTTCSSTTYTADGLPRSISYGNNVSAQLTYDDHSRALIHKTVTRGGNTKLIDAHYSYDATNRLHHVVDKAQQTHYFGNHVIEPSYDYTYDAMGQLVVAQGRQQINTSHGGGQSFREYEPQSLTEPNGIPSGNHMCKYMETYEYDDVGNIWKMRHEAVDNTNVSGWTKEYFYEKKNNRLLHTQTGRPSEDYKYEGHSEKSGCVTSVSGYRAFTWDFADRLRSSSTHILNDGTPETTWYVYDSTGARVRKVVERAARGDATPARLKDTFYLGSLQIFRKYAGNGSTITLETHSSDVVGPDRIAVVESCKIGKARKPLLRYLVSANLELGDNGQILTYEEYSPFGATTYLACGKDVELPSRYRYAAYERDRETGLYYCRARYYAPWLGRWISPDPKGLIDGLNLFSYCRNDPVNFYDPSGFNLLPHVSDAVREDKQEDIQKRIEAKREKEKMEAEIAAKEAKLAAAEKLKKDAEEEAGNLLSIMNAMSTPDKSPLVFGMKTKKAEPYEPRYEGMEKEDLDYYLSKREGGKTVQEAMESNLAHLTPEQRKELFPSYESLNSNKGNDVTTVELAPSLDKNGKSLSKSKPQSLFGSMRKGLAKLFGSRKPSSGSVPPVQRPRNVASKQTSISKASPKQQRSQQK